MNRSIVLALGVLALGPMGCVADRPLRSVEVVLETSPPADGLVLETATLGLAAIVLEGPATARRLDLLIPTAHAHPGHGSAGGVVGELLYPDPIDLLAPPNSLGQADVYAGAIASGRIRLDADVTVVLEGTAPHPDTGEAVGFSFHRVVDAEVTGLPLVATLAVDGSPPTLGLTVDLDSALSFVDWSSPDTNADGQLTSDDGSIGESVDFGLVSTRTWSLSMETP